MFGGGGVGVFSINEGEGKLTDGEGFEIKVDALVVTMPDIADVPEEAGVVILRELPAVAGAVIFGEVNAELFAGGHLVDERELVGDGVGAAGGEEEEENEKQNENERGERGFGKSWEREREWE